MVETGSIAAGMDVAIEASSDDHPTIDELFEVSHRRDKDPALLERALRSPLASRPRQEIKKWLMRLKAGRSG